MNAEKVQQAIDIYRKKLEELEVSTTPYPHETLLDSSARGLEHCHQMLDKMEGFLQENKMEKVFRWLGFVQGVLWAEKIYTIAELANHNRSDSE